MLILDLSAQVSQQDARITELENKLHEKNKQIEALQKSQSRANSDSKRRQMDDTWSPESVKSAANETSAEVDELKQIAEEMKALKMGKRTTGKKKRVVKKQEESDYRGSSGASRDSGIHDYGADGSRSRSPADHMVESLHRESSLLVDGLMSSAMRVFDRVPRDGRRAPDLEDLSPHRTEGSEVGSTSRTVEQTTCRTLLSDEDDKWPSDNEHEIEVEEDRNMNIRRISAAKKRPKSKEPGEIATLMWDKGAGGKPPVYKGVHKSLRGGDDYKDLDSLINSIDEDTLGIAGVRRVNYIPEVSA